MGNLEGYQKQPLKRDLRNTLAASRDNISRHSHLIQVSESEVTVQ